MRGGGLCCGTVAVEGFYQRLVVIRFSDMLLLFRKRTVNFLDQL